MKPGAPPSPPRARDRALATGLFLLLLALYTATFTGAPENPDAEVEFQTTSSLARRGRLDIGGTPEAEGLIAAPRVGRTGTGFGLAPGGPGREERLYSWFGVGQAFAGLPFYWAGAACERLFPGIEEAHRATRLFGIPRSEYFPHLFSGWRNALFGALTATLLYLAARRAGASARAALEASLAYGLATFAWPQARSTLSDVQATLCLFAGFHGLLLARARWAEHGRVPLSPLAAAGLALGLAWLTRVAVAPAVALLGLTAVLLILARGRSAGWRRTLAALSALGLPFLACAGVFVATNLLRFGRPLETGYGTALEDGGFFSGSPWAGAAGLLLSPGKGLLWMAPGLVLAPLGLARAVQRGERGLAALIVAVALAVGGPITFMQGWHGAWTYGPRYVLPLLPFLFVGVALALDPPPARPRRGLLAHAVLWAGLATSLPGVLVDYTTHQDLAQRAARFAWPAVPGDNDFQRDDDRFLRIQWDPRFAAPWAHWRILSHRAQGRGETFPVAELFFLPTPETLTVGEERWQGMNHLAWVDFSRRLGGPLWPAAVLVGALLLGSLTAFARGRRGPDPRPDPWGGAGGPGLKGP